MPFSTMGFGTILAGERLINEDEYTKWHKKFSYIPEKKDEIMIATESISLLWIPCIPFRTLIYYYIDYDHDGGTYHILYFPSGKYRIYWRHVKKEWVFYISPIVILLIIVNIIF